MIPRIFRNTYFWGLLYVVWAAILWWMSSQPRLPTPLPRFQYADKIAHFSYFFLGGIFLACAIASRVSSPNRRQLWCVLLCSAAIGAVDEFHQSFVPNRVGNDPADWIADVCGGTAAATVVFYGLKKWRTRAEAITAPPEPV